MTHLETKAKEESYYVVTVGTTFTPSAMKWKLTDEDGTVINSRTSVAVAAPSTASAIALNGADLTVSNSKKTKRILTVYGTYNGAANNFADECSFYIEELKGIT